MIRAGMTETKKRKKKVEKKSDPLPWKTNTNPTSTTYQPLHFVGPQFWWRQVTFHNYTTAHLVKMCFSPARNQIVPTIGKENICRQLDQRKKMSRLKSSTSTVHIGDTL